MIPILSDFTQVFNRSILLKITPLVSKKKIEKCKWILENDGRTESYHGGTSYTRLSPWSLFQLQKSFFMCVLMSFLQNA